MWIGVTTFIITVLCIWFYHAPLENHANPQVTPLGTTAPWYFLWIQGVLKLGDKFFWGIAFPTIVLGALALLPYIDVTPSRRYAHSRVTLTFAMLLVSFATITSYMGLAKFAVETSAETEIVHELTFEPAHAHVGIGRTIPFDQMIAGAYTTAQFHSDSEHLIEGEQFEQLLEELNKQHLTAAQAPSRFRPIPEQEAPVLLEVMEDFNHLLEESPLELWNSWGALIVTDNQDGLKRLDWVVSWDSVLLEGGNVKVDDEGIPIVLTEEVEAPVLDDDGNPVFDEEGEPVLELVDVPIRRIYSAHLFIHEDGAYFD
jgi:hypothetical protein